ncbi:MAG: glutaredoxin family protein [Burkholderiales bacterium]
MCTVTRTISIFAVALSALATAHAQQPMFRSVGPDGRVTYSDRAPIEPRTESRTVLGASAPPAATMPFELRQAVSRHPVTLYTSSDCAPCASARDLLNARGVPFSERTVTSHDEIAALKTLSGAQSVPFATIGSQKLSGFSEGEWRKYLDAAAYPEKSQLPAGYHQAESQPLVEAKRVEPARPEATPRAAAAPAARPPAASNPAGIRF